MTHLLAMLKWDAVLQSRYRIIHLSILSVVIYYILLAAVPEMNTDEFKMLYLFFDPTLIGIMFVGALVLFEKTENTLQALTITPLEVRTYFLSKIITLTTLATGTAALFLLLAHGPSFDVACLLAGIVLTSVFLVLVGFLIVARCRSVNEYLVMMMGAFLVLFLPPLLDVFGIYENAVFYLWPSQASFLLFEGVFGAVPLVETAYAVLYLSAWVCLCYLLAKQAFHTHIVSKGG